MKSTLLPSLLVLLFASACATGRGTARTADADGDGYVPNFSQYADDGFVEVSAAGSTAATFERDPASTDPRSGPADIAKCVKAVKDACGISGNDTDRIEDNVQLCKQVQSRSGRTKLQVFLLKNSERFVVVKIAGDGGPYAKCSRVKYTVDGSGLRDFKVIQGKAFLLSRDGTLYVMMPDENFYVVPNSGGVEYKGIANIRGLNGGTSIELQFAQRGQAPFELTDDILRRRLQLDRRAADRTACNVGRIGVKNAKNTCELEFAFVTTERSLFRDE